MHKQKKHQPCQGWPEEQWENKMTTRPDLLRKYADMLAEAEKCAEEDEKEVSDKDDGEDKEDDLPPWLMKKDKGSKKV
jgi:hypothetical protein